MSQPKRIHSAYLRLQIFVLLGFLTACAMQDTHTSTLDHEFESSKTLIASGHVDEGIAKLKALLIKQPDNPQYRSYLKNQQDLKIANMLIAADAQVQKHAYSEAEKAYQDVLLTDPQNQAAFEGLSHLNMIGKHEKLLNHAQSLFSQNDLDGAAMVVQSVLAEDASQPIARKLFEEIEQKRSDKVTNIPKIKSAFSKPITLEFKDIPIKSVFEFIAKVSKINFTFDPEFPQDTKTSIFVRNTSIDDAIQTILTTHHLEKKVLNENTLLIYPSSHNSAYQELFVRSFYLGTLDPKRAMNMLKTILKAKDVYIDEKLNTLVMRDTAANIHLAEKLVMSQDLADPEVMLEVQVMEVNRKTLEGIGIQYPTQASLGVRGTLTSAGITTVTPGQLSLTQLQNFNSDLGVFAISDPVLALNLLNQDTDTNLLANPHIRVKNREKAKILVGDKIPLFTSIANATGFVSETISYLEVGIKLDVEPTVLLNDEVSIKVALEVSNQTDQVKSSSGTLAYTIGTRNANTVLRLKNGETQVLAGLFRDDSQNIKNKVPGLSSLPLIGRLFSDKNSDRRKKEIVLLITPRILSNITPPNAIYSAFPSGVDLAGSGQKSDSRSSEYVAPAAVPATKSVQDVQAERAQMDKAFGESVMQPASGTSKP